MISIEYEIIPTNKKLRFQGHIIKIKNAKIVMLNIVEFEACPP